MTFVCGAGCPQPAIPCAFQCCRRPPGCRCQEYRLAAGAAHEGTANDPFCLSNGALREGEDEIAGAISAPGRLPCKKSGGLTSARPFAHKLHRAPVMLYKMPAGQNQSQQRSGNHKRQGCSWQTRLPAQTNVLTAGLMVHMTCRAVMCFRKNLSCIRNSDDIRPCSGVSELQLDGIGHGT